MKIILMLLCAALAGCGAKSNEEIARDLITEKLKTTLPDFNNYESVNFGTMGSAFLPFEETDQYITHSKEIKECKDSIVVLEQLINDTKTASTTINSYKERLQQLQDSTKVKSERNNAAKQSYVPEKLFKISHAYKIKDKAGLEKQTEEEFYFDKEMKRVVKVHKVY